MTAPTPEDDVSGPKVARGTPPGPAIGAHRRPPTVTDGPAPHGPARSARQSNCTDRFAIPIQNPSITDRCALGRPPASAAPMVTNSGAKCSVRGWA
ncbi:hypothetical protein HGI09_37070 [Streptomyces collinus]|nr:hypothetical protein HGI10_27050 [Streptomyces collinus]UJA16356.1 hypothetical protein HGI09_37070 [Streptomyces collinus]